MTSPQPLSTANPRAHFRPALGTAYADLHPELYHMALRVIALASYGEKSWGHMFGNLLHAAPLPSFAIYQRLDSASAKKAILMAAAESELSEGDYRWLQALQKAIAPAFKVRNQFAHHLWGDSTEIPDALLLADPIIMVESVKWGLQSMVLQTRGEPVDDVVHRGGEYDLSKIMVWSREALAAAVEDMTRAVTGIKVMAEICSPYDTEGERNRKQTALLKWPRFAEALKGIEAKIPQ